IPLAVHNDANLAALGEYTFGIGAGSRLFVYVMIGTGLGMGVVSEGQLFIGAHGGAGPILLPYGYESLLRDRPAPLVRQVGPMTARQLLTPDLPPRCATPDLPGACVPTASPTRPQAVPRSRRRPPSTGTRSGPRPRE
ncbi:ROK family protein, partial [Streptomyces rubiginosohelvolus]